MGMREKLRGLIDGFYLNCFAPTNRKLTDHLIANDVVPVVRCKNCVHYDFGVCLKIYSDGAVSQYAWQARKKDDFCSYGERRTDDHT